MVDVVQMKTLVFDYARPNRYKVVITPPGEDPGDSSFFEQIGETFTNFFTAERQVNLNCNSVQFPGANVSTFNHKIQGPTEQRPYEVLYDDLDMEFYLDSGHTERKFFTNWLNLIKNPQNNMFNFKQEYASIIEIFQIDNLNVETYTVEVVDAWPINIGEVELSYDQTDAVSTFQVSFAYKTWRETFTGGVTGGITSGNFSF